MPLVKLVFDLQRRCVAITLEFLSRMKLLPLCHVWNCCHFVTYEIVVTLTHACSFVYWSVPVHTPQPPVGTNVHVVRSVGRSLSAAAPWWWWRWCRQRWGRERHGPAARFGFCCFLMNEKGHYICRPTHCKLMPLQSKAESEKLDCTWTAFSMVGGMFRSKIQPFSAHCYA